MVTVVLSRRVLPSVIAMIVAATALAITGRAISAPTGAQKLPDLVQVTPTDPAPPPRVKTIATGLAVPWEIAFLPDGRALVTERQGRVRLLERGHRLRRKPVARVAVSTQGEGGLLGLAIDPDFAANRFVYLYYTQARSMRVERWRFVHGRLERARSLIPGILAGRVHDSGRIAFGPDRRLYVATGDAGDGELAQRTDSLNGKFLALAPEQYRGAGGVEIISRGHRNPQGFDWDPARGG